MSLKVHYFFTFFVNSVLSKIQENVVKKEKKMHKLLLKPTVTHNYFIRQGYFDYFLKKVA